ncbi:hypothetical protein M8J75_010625 [Diaphorina citri]|nr:hypothetical protein M8J75_010625 [Diaphorina citri]
MADDFVEKKLTDWGLGQYITVFRDNDIDTAALSVLDDVTNEIALNALIPSIGHRLSLKAKLNELKRDTETTGLLCQVT